MNREKEKTRAQKVVPGVLDNMRKGVKYGEIGEFFFGGSRKITPQQHKLEHVDGRLPSNGEWPVQP